MALLILMLKQPNAGVALSFRIRAERKCPTPTRFGVLQRKIKICFRYLKIIFNKKIIITFIISVIIFNIYTLFLNHKYEKFYKTVKPEIEFQAVIISSPKENEYYNSYKIKGKTGEFKNKKFILYVKKEIELEYGDRIKITGQFSEPDDIRNYKGFSYKRYLQTEKIYGTIKAEKIEVKSKDNTMLIFKLSNSVRNKIIEQIKNVLPQETSGLLIGLMLGEKSFISEEVRLDFQKSSLAHILAVSGAHVSYIILGLNYLVSINKTHKKSGYFFIIFILIVFIFITNFSVSVIRACVMSIILIISKLFYRKSDITNTIAISVLIIIIFNPYSINSVSMQLSYLGTIGVIYVAPIVEMFLKDKTERWADTGPTPTDERTRQKYKIMGLGGWPKVIKTISVPIAAQITILPIMIKNFNTLSFTFLISNLIAMPLLGISIIGGFLLTFLSFIWLWGAQQIGIIFNIILKALMFIANFCGNLKLSNVYVITPSTIMIVIYYVAIFIALYCFNMNRADRGVRPYIRKRLIQTRCGGIIKKLLIIMFVLIIIIEIPYTNYNGKLKIYFIDVGQR